MATFRELGLSEPLLEALAHLGYEEPTPIQRAAIPPLLEGHDIIGQAQTVSCPVHQSSTTSSLQPIQRSRHLADRNVALACRR